MAITIKDLIDQGKEIENGLTYVKPLSGIKRPIDVYDLSDMDEYHRWKELSIRFLQMYSLQA